MDFEKDPEILDTVVAALTGVLHEATRYENPYQARHTVTAVSAITKRIMQAIRETPELNYAQASIDRLIATGKAVSAQVPQLCPECNEPHRDGSRLCKFCAAETAE